MAFKKIDADAVNGGQPLDAFVLQGVSANLIAARANRPRRVDGICFPEDNQKIVAAHKTVALTLGTWPVMRGVTEVSITVLHDIADANVNMALAKMTPRGLDKADDDLTAVSTGTDTITTLACDVAAEQGREVELFLLVKSDVATSPAQQEVTIDGATDGNVIKNPSKVQLPSGHGITLFGNTDDRWAIRFDEASSGSLVEPGDTLPGPRTVIQMEDPSGDTELWLWPRFAPEDVENLVNWSQGNYKVVVDTLGRSTIKGISFHDSAVTAFSDLTGQLLPGRPLPGRVGSELYTRGRTIHSEHTRIYHAGPTYDRSRQDTASKEITMWGEIAPYSSSTRATVGSCWAGTYPQNTINGGSTRYKSTIKVAGVLALVSPFPSSSAPSARLSVRASIFSFSGGAWTGSETNGTAVTVEAPIIGSGGNYYGQETHESGPLFYFGTRGIDGQAWHYLRSAVGADDLNLTGAGLVRFACEVDDDQTSAADRMLRVEVIGLDAESGIVGWGAYPGVIHCLAFTAWEAEGTVAT